MSEQKFRLVTAKNGYFRCMTTIGPRFGATKEEAAVFDSRVKAASAYGLHWAMGDCELESVEL